MKNLISMLKKGFNYENGETTIYTRKNSQKNEKLHKGTKSL